MILCNLQELPVSLCCVTHLLPLHCAVLWELSSNSRKRMKLPLITEGAWKDKGMHSKGHLSILWLWGYSQTFVLVLTHCLFPLASLMNTPHWEGTLTLLSNPYHHQDPGQACLLQGSSRTLCQHFPLLSLIFQYSCWSIFSKYSLTILLYACM